MASFALAAYFLAQTALLALWRFKPEADRGLSVCSAALLMCGAAFRVGGFDYDNYVRMIDNVQAVAGKSLVVQMLIARDPVMLAVIHGCYVFSDSTRPVFVVMAMLAGIPKLAVAQRLVGRATVFMVVYSIFLAPGLEFAAIRAAVSIGFLMVFLAYEGGLIGKAIAAVASVGAHISALPFLISRLGGRFRGAVAPVVLPILIAVCSFEGSSIIWLFPRSVDYENNQGTLNAVVIALLSYLIYVVTCLTAPRVEDLPVFGRARLASAVGLGLGIGLIPVSVTAAVRFMESGWVFLAMALTLGAGLVPRLQWRLSYQTGIFGAFLVFLALMDVMRHIWPLPI